MTKAFLYIAASIALLSAGPVSAGQFETGEKLYKENCSACHGVNGEKGTGYDYPIWGEKTSVTKFGTAKGLFEYLQFLMPFDDPQKITDAQKLDVVQFMMVKHGAIKESDALTPDNSSTVQIK